MNLCSKKHNNILWASNIFEIQMEYVSHIYLKSYRYKRSVGHVKLKYNMLVNFDVKSKEYLLS